MATDFKATYFISISGLTIGKADVAARFASGQYATAIKGSTFGLSRFVSDAKAQMAGNGWVKTDRVVPSTYNLDTEEKGLGTRVRMEMRSGAISSLIAMPDLIEADDRIVVTAGHKRNVVDPIGAFLLVRGNTPLTDGKTICNRTIKVFDGWQRFDVRLFYKHMKDISVDGYKGPSVVCGARYVPVAGHRPERDSVRYMTENTRLEVWLAPIEGTTVMVPYYILIGTAAGDLVVKASRFSVTGSETQASAR